jgi:hypothetical protein
VSEESKLKELLEGGPQLTSLKEWREIDNVFRSVQSLPSITAKLEIGQHDLYLKTAWYRGRIVRIDITLSRGHDAHDDLPKTGQQASLETTRYDLARSWVEDSCRLASNLLQTGQVGIATIIENWIGMEGYPVGYCKQLPGVNPDTGEVGPSFQKGPLHAAAALILRRLVEWTERMEGVE